MATTLRPSASLRLPVSQPGRGSSRTGAVTTGSGAGAGTTGSGIGSSRGTSTVTFPFATGTLTLVVQSLKPGAFATNTSLPPSVGTARFHSAGSTAAPLRVSVMPS